MAKVIGRITVNNKVIYEVDALPAAGAGTPAVRGSLAMFDSGTVGTLHVKTGTADTAWQQVDVPEGQDWELDGNILTDAGGGQPNEFLGSTNDFDLAFKRNDQELMRLASTGLLIGLTASLGGRLQVQSSALGEELMKQISLAGAVGGASVIKVSRQYKVQTTDAIQGILASILIPDESRVQINGSVMARQHGGIAGNIGDGADYIQTVSAKRDGGNAILNGWSSDFTEEDLPASAFSVDRDVNVNNIDIGVTGQADRDIAWSAHFDIMIAVD